MRIEPTSKILPRQTSTRRQRADALNPVDTRGNGPDASTGRVESRDIVPLDQTFHRQRRVNARRWRSYVPFIAQYIGQETAIETSQRYARRHSESAGSAYQKQTSLTPLPRTVARI